MIARRKKRQNDYQRRYRAKAEEVAERTRKRRLEEAKRSENRYWSRYRLACRIAKERGDRHLAHEDLVAVGLQS